MKEKKMCLLQLFAEAEAAAGRTGETAADAGQQGSAAAPQRAQTRDAAAAGSASSRVTWEEVKADPQFNREIQNIVKERLKADRKKDAPQPEAEDLQAHFDAHFRSLERQAETMKTLFPGFDLRSALDDPAFARMTAPDVGISVEDAYYALHRGEIQSAAMQVAAQKTAQMISDSIRCGKMRPSENGAQAQGASVAGFDYRAASPKQRSDLKKRIRDAAARGEKLYPGM